MIKKLLSLLVLFSWLGSSHAQFTDNFTDGDFTNNPTWVGGNSDFLINPSFQLQSNNTTANSTFYLSTANSKATNAQWDFYCQFTFNTSGANYTDVYLTASASDISQAATTGYFVRIGNTDDEISLYRKDATASVKIIDGTNGITNSSNNTLRIRVIRDANNLWTLSRDITGAGASFVAEGTVVDQVYLTSSFFGILVRQSTASFFQRHFFDNISVVDFTPDVTAPLLQSATAINATSADVLFNEPVSLASSQQVTNYSVNNSIGNPISAQRDATNTALVHLSFGSSFPNRTPLQLTVNGVADVAGNAINNGTASFTYFNAVQYDVLITELMADPTPLVGLPDAEWVELRNTSGFDINLQGWRIGKPTGQSGPMPFYNLRADSAVIVCTGSAVPVLLAFGATISVTSFPSLNNTGDLLYLRSNQGAVIHAVNYTDAWYQNELKKGGGWTLEMQDTNNPCAGISNWKASNNSAGGTAGKLNSVNGVNPDKTAPSLFRAYAPDSVTVVLVFNEPLDSVAAANLTSYSISNGIGIAQAVPLSFVFDRVQLRLGTPLLRNNIYTVTANGVKDCAGNSIGNARTAKVGLFESLLPYDAVVNEILFNPAPSSNDYVEVYNRSNKIINLRQMYLANRNSSGAFSSITQVSTEDYLLFPQDFMVFTENASLVKATYVANNPAAFIEVSMPSFSDDEGNVILLNEQGAVVDDIPYKDDWHFALISNDEGVALERINYDDTTRNNPTTVNIDEQAQNWHSAATNIGYGTPTYRNSQFRIDATVQGTVKITPETISPDNDGFDDFATIHYNFPAPGYVANISIFDAAGRPVRYLQRNALCGTQGFFRWDGLGDRAQPLAVGIYVLYTEVFNLEGKSKKFKNVVVLARKR
jgi:hypothetical protein